MTQLYLSIVYVLKRGVHVLQVHMCVLMPSQPAPMTPHQAKNVPDAQFGTSNIFFFRKLNQVPDRLRTASVIVFLCRA